ncbi:MAG: ABC transporter substrate-binding protein [Rhodocyclaceae bacterium]|nr:ABC transporter substrate-binding protein [Rhodocyclaceae bacterium]
MNKLLSALLLSLSFTAAVAAPVTLESPVGKVTVEDDVDKVAVLDFAALDTLNTLEGGDKVIGLPLAATVPAQLSSFKNDKMIDFGNVKEVNLEKLAAAKPQLVIIGGRLALQGKTISEIAPTYQFSLDMENYWTSFRQQTMNIAQLTGKTQLAEQKLAALEEKIADIKKKSEGKSALIILVNNGKMAAFGSRSRFGIIHDSLGFAPIDPSIKVGTHGQGISHEFIAEKNPDYLFVIDRGAAVSNKTGQAQQTLDNDIVKKSKAFKNGNIVYLNARNWYLMNGGLSAMGEMIDEVAAAVK